MSLQMVLLPVFVQVGLTFALLLWLSRSRTNGDGPVDQFDLPVLFYVLIALTLPIRHADLVIVMLSWVFVVTRFVHAGVLVGAAEARQRSMAWLAGALVLLAMWLYFALKILILI
ncbi:MULTISPECIES: MAPEG family protein [unclassified Bradyrhizobium]|uniref:MAPEG family protein n=1 Tax=unclassified Bradyrhizobium TaxID=2631580 RepID=UPI0028EDB9F4|nr:MULTISPECIES: MAPEG family protein [unclassified Bradyrhizobium]